MFAVVLRLFTATGSLKRVRREEETVGTSKTSPRDAPLSTLHAENDIPSADR